MIEIQKCLIYYVGYVIIKCNLYLEDSIIVIITIIIYYFYQRVIIAK